MAITFFSCFFACNALCDIASGKKCSAFMLILSFRIRVLSINHYLISMLLYSSFFPPRSKNDTMKSSPETSQLRSNEAISLLGFKK